ncbi:MAG: hypothetical protein LR017_01145 [Candidatus Pacebacteria bacterium]|nr:hypothetical protein [Candidatus Paceibacterota bacterium]
MTIESSALFSLSAEGVFYVLLGVFTVHAIFLGYHWFNYGEKRRVALTALTVYLLGGAVLFLALAFLLRTL